MPRSWPRLDAVDALRGIAILFVLMNHVNMRLYLAKVPYTASLPHQLVSSLVWNGQYGVQIFFAVSGFLITSTSLRRWGSLGRVNLRDFYALRFARLAPLLLLVLALLCALHAANLQDFVVSPATGGLGRALTAALTFHVNLLEAQRGYLPASWDVLWSLSVEETFYVFFPLLCRVLGRGTPWLLTALLITFVLLGPIARTAFSHGNEVWQEYSYLGGMDAIALGCLTALALARTKPPPTIAWLLGGLGTALLIFILCLSLRAEAWGLIRLGLDMTLLAIGTCMIIAACAELQWQSPRALAPLLKIGRRSYEVYLTHMFVVFTLFDLFVTAGKPLRAVPILFIGSVLIAGLLGELIAHLYSDPMNRRLRKFWGDGPDELGAVTESGTANPSSRKK